MTTTTSYRAATRSFFLWDIHVVETVFDVDGVETVGPVIGIFPTAALADAYAQSIPATTVSD